MGDLGAFFGHLVTVLGPSWAAKKIKHWMSKKYRKIQYKIKIFASPRDAWNHPGGVLRRPKRATLGNLCPPTGMSRQARHTTRQHRRKNKGSPLIGGCILAPGSHCGGNIRGVTNQHTEDLTRPGPKARRIYAFRIRLRTTFLN